jgi:hypothetical protein
MTTANAPIESKWSGFKLLRGFNDPAKSAQNKAAAAARVQTAPLGEPPAPIAVRRPENSFTVRVEAFRQNRLTQKIESYIAIADCKGAGPIEAVENLLAQLKTGAATFK